MTARPKGLSGPRPGTTEFDERAAIARVMRLMAIPGRSGHERAIAEAIRRELLAAGARRGWFSMDDAGRRSPYLGGRGDCGNLVLQLPGTTPGPRRLLMAHLDTVPLCEGSRPAHRSGRIVSANRSTALGADDRGGCAAILTAAVEVLRRRRPHPPLTFMWSVQEEVGMFGARFVRLGRLGGPKLAFNWDGSPPDRACIGATGACRMEITIHGAASHAGVCPEQGVSAADIFALAVADLRRGGWHGLVLKGGRRGTSNIGPVHGGEATNVVLDRLEVSAEARAHEPAFRRRIVAAWRLAFARAARRVRSSKGRRGRVAFRVTPTYEAFRLPEGHPAVVEALAAIRAAGLPAYVGVGTGGLDANWMIARGIPTVTMGTGFHKVHRVGEYLGVREYLAACRVALLLATGHPAGPR